MDSYMSDNRGMLADQLEEARSDFLRTIRTVAAGFGEYSFQRWDPKQERWRGQVLASLFDAEMFAARELSADIVAPRQPEIVEGVKELMINPDFRQAIDAATNTPTYFKARIQMMRNMMFDVANR